MTVALCGHPEARQSVPLPDDMPAPGTPEFLDHLRDRFGRNSYVYRLAVETIRGTAAPIAGPPRTVEGLTLLLAEACDTAGIPATMIGANSLRVSLPGQSVAIRLDGGAVLRIADEDETPSDQFPVFPPGHPEAESCGSVSPVGHGFVEAGWDE